MNTIASINKEKIQVLKEELKTIAEEIKTAKPAFKNSQRNNDKPWVYRSKLHSLQFQFRHRLIAYSLTKGKKYGEVERSVREGNLPNWIFIKGLQDELTN